MHGGTEVLVVVAAPFRAGAVALVCYMTVTFYLKKCVLKERIKL